MNNSNMDFLTMIIDVLLACLADNQYIMTCEEMINDARIDNWFRAKYLRLCLLYHGFVLWETTSLHYSMYCTCPVEPIVRSIRDFNCQKSMVAFSAS